MAQQQQKTISVKIPHRLPRAEARERLQSGVSRLKAQYGTQVAQVDDRWTGDRMDFKVTAMGQSITGRLDVEADDVRVEVDLPWFLAMFGDRIRTEVEQQGRKLLEKK